jgi:hypothetical protein
MAAGRLEGLLIDIERVEEIVHLGVAGFVT